MYNDSGEFVEYAYNAEGALSKLTHRNSAGNVISVYEFKRDKLGCMIRSRQIGGNGATVQRTAQTYDAIGRLSGQQWAVGSKTFSESYTYNDGSNGNGLPDTVTLATQDTVKYNYDELQRLSSTMVTNSTGAVLLRTGYTYSAGKSANQTSLQPRIFTIWNPTYQALDSYRYTYDSRGNITKIEDVSGTTARTLSEYKYNT